MSRKLAITAADGQTAHLIAELLLTDENFHDKFASITCISANTEACTDLAELGALVIPHPESRNASKTLAKSLKEHEVDTVFVVPPAKENKVELTRDIVEAAKECGIKNVVLLSTAALEYATEDHPKLMEFKEIEALFLPAKGVTDTDAGHSPVVIRAGFYAENILLYAPDAKQTQKLSLPLGPSHKFAPIALGDIAQVAAHVLSSEGPMGLGDLVRGQLIVMTGPMLMSGTELAEAATKALGQEIEYEDVSEEEAKATLSQTTLDPSEQALLLEFYSLVREGKTNYVSTLAFHAIVGDAEGKTGRDVMPQQMVEFFKTYDGEFKNKKRKMRK